MRTTIQIRKADEHLYPILQEFNVSQFFSDMMNKHLQDWVKEQMENKSNQVEFLQSITQK